MEAGVAAAELAGPLELLPPVDFCCAYGSSLLPNNDNKMIKYGVVRMQDLARDVQTWDRFYLSGRLQKPVHILVDNFDIGKVNAVNLKAATSAALLLSAPEFTEEELYSKICSLSYMGDLRMLFAEDKNKENVSFRFVNIFMAQKRVDMICLQQVNKIVKGSFSSFQKMYKPFVAEYIIEGLLKSSTNACQRAFKQDCGLSATRSLFSSLPWTIQAGLKMTEKGTREAGGVMPQGAIASREEAVNCTRRVLRRLVMVSSARQAVSGLLAAGGVNAARYLGKKITKAWRSRVS